MRMAFDFDGAVAIHVVLAFGVGDVHLDGSGSFVPG